MKSFLFLLASTACGLMAQNPAITQILNNYGLVNNGTVAKGAIFIVKGSNLADQETDTLQNVPLQTSLRGVEIRITVGGATTAAPLYYALNFQLAGILPSNTPAGTGTLVVINNGKTSAPAAITVVNSAFGMLTVNGGGTGLAAVHDPNYSLLSNTNSSRPAMNVTFYGSGLGGVTGDETILQTPVDLRPGITVTVTIGGVNATVLYAGRTIYPGLDQINVTIPTLQSYSCTVAVIIATNGVQANAGTIPVTQSGTTCQAGGGGDGDSGGDTGFTQEEINRFISQGSYTGGQVGTGRSTAYSVDGTTGVTTTTKQDTVSAQFSRVGGPDLARSLRGELPPGYAQYIPQRGSCIVYNTIPQNPYPQLTATLLDAGPAITVNGPNGTQVAVKTNQQVSGITYSAPNVPNTYLAAGAYTFNGTGGPDVNAFSGGMNIPTEFVVTNNPSEFTNINRSQPITVRWTGGDPATDVQITGSSFTLNGQVLSTPTVFICLAPNPAGQFTVPAGVLSQLPASTAISAGPITINVPGSFAVATTTRGTRINIPGLDYGVAAHQWGWAYTPTYK